MLKKLHPLLLSALLGCTWALVVPLLVHLINVAWSWSHGHGGFEMLSLRGARGAWRVLVLGAIVGVCFGFLSRGFLRLSHIGRIWFAAATLYLAGPLYFVLGSLLFGPLTPGAHMGLRDLLFTSLVVAWYGLTTSGLVLVLWPLAYASNRLVDQCWRDLAATTAPAESADA